MDAGTLAKLKVLLNLDDRGFRSGLSGAEKQARGFGSVLKSIFTMAGGFVVAQAVIAITRAFAQGIGSAISFGKEMANVNSIAQLSEAALSALSDQVIELSKDSRISDAPATLAAGLYNIISSGFQAADAMMILQAAAIAATAGLTTTSTSAAAITAVLNAYQLTASDATAVSNSLFQTVNLGVLSFEELASSIGRVLPTAHATGVSLDELGAAYATLTRQGVNADEATTRINAVLTGLLKPTDALSNALALYGYSSGEALLKSEGLGGALDVLNKIMGGSAEKANEMFGDIRQAQGAIGLTVSDVAFYNDMLGQMGNAQEGAGATAKALAEQMKSASFQFGQVKKQAIILVTTFFRLLEPSLAGIARGFAKLLLTVTNFVSFFAEVIRGTKMITQSFGAMGTSFTHETTNITDALDKIPKSLQNFALGVGAVISMVKLFVTSMIAAWGSTIRVNDLVARFPEPLQKVAKFMLLAADAVGYFVRTLRKDGLMAALGLLPDLLHQVWSGLRGLVSEGLKLGKVALSATLELAGDLWDASRDFRGWLWNKIKGNWASLLAIGVTTVAGGLILGGLLALILKTGFGPWLWRQISIGWDHTIDAGVIFVKASLKLASDIDWGQFGKDIATGAAGAVRDAAFEFSPADMFNFGEALGEGIGPALDGAVRGAFNSFKADPVGAAKVAGEIALAIAAVLLSPILIPAILVGALAVWVGAGILGLVNGIVSSTLGIDFKGVATAIVNAIGDAFDAVTDFVTTATTLATNLVDAVADVDFGAVGAEIAGAIWDEIKSIVGGWSLKDFLPSWAGGDDGRHSNPSVSDPRGGGPINQLTGNVSAFVGGLSDISSKVKSFADTVSGHFSDMKTSISTNLDAGTRSVQNFANQAISQIQRWGSTTRSVVTSTTQQSTGLLNVFASQAAALGGKAADTFLAGFNRIRQAASTSSSAMGQIRSALSGSLYGPGDALGSSFGQGLIGGMNRYLGAVYDAANRIADQIFQGANARIRMGSPSKAAIELAASVPMGFEWALMRGIPAVTAAADRLASATMGTPSSPQLAYAGSPTMSRGGNVYNFQPGAFVLPNVTNADEFAGEFPAAFARKLDRTVAG